MFPSYSYPKSIVTGLVAAVLFRRRRSFRLDGQACLQRLQPSLQIMGQENVPASGPGLILFNHYYRPGFNAWWMALALAATIPLDVHFIMTGELTYPGKWYASLGMAGSRWLLKRISRVYGFTTMPPMPPRPRDVQARASSVRAALAFAQSHPRALLALAPEGGDQPGGRLAWPPSGTGRFIALLAGSGAPVIPVGVYEDSGTLCLNFGRPFHFTVPAGLSADAKDRYVSELAMQALARRVPPRLQGEFAGAVSHTELPLSVGPNNS